MFLGTDASTVSALSPWLLRGILWFLPFEVIPFAGLHGKVFLLSRKMDLVISNFGSCFIWRIAQVVLTPQFLLNLPVDLFNRQLFGDFKKASAGLFGNPFQGF